LSPLFFAMLGDIDLIFSMWVYNDELQIKFTFRSGPMNLGRVMALGLWNFAKYLVVTTLFYYEKEKGQTMIYKTLQKLDVSSPPWILRRCTNVSLFFNSLINRLRMTNYCLRSVSSSLLKFTHCLSFDFQLLITFWYLQKYFVSNI
jgi:hypothetical protein